MKLTRNKIIAAMLISFVLLIAFYSSGPSTSKQNAADTPVETVLPSSSPASSVVPATSSAPLAPVPTQATVPTSPLHQESAKATVSPAAERSAEPKPTAPAKETAAATETAPVVTASPTAKDPYLTDPVPEGKPAPIEPQKAAISDKPMTAYLSVSCLTILNNMNKLNAEKIELVPTDGIIFKAQEVTFYEGESVFNVLQREMKKHKIHMEFENTPIYNSAYIEGIHNLYEFDCGELSGWMYKVNGWFPNYGSSRYQLKQGDVIEWVYTCDLGRDVGDTYTGTQGGKQ
jgi:hypothetical protein